MCLNELYTKVYVWEDKGKKYKFNLRNRNFSNGLPKYLYVSQFNCLKNYSGFLSGRMLSNVLYQLNGMLKGELKSSKSLHHRFEMPNLSNINPEIFPKNLEIIENKNPDSVLGLYITLVNFTNKRSENIMIPIRLHEMDDKHSEKGTLMNSILLSNSYIDLRYEFEGLKPEDNKKEKKVGGDTGINKIVTLSDGQMIPKENNQGKTYKDIEAKIYKKKSGSKAQKNAIYEMKCFTREVINDLDLEEIKELKLESNKGIKINTKNANKYWQRQVINDKMKYKCQDNGIKLISTLSPFKSLRCPECGFVHKKNRYKEKFFCTHCSYENDADVVSSINNNVQLPYVDLWVYSKIAKTSGFFWSSEGIVVADNNTGRCASPDSIKLTKLKKS
jgi:DNA-directed RNA polymerase subunit RPC12/RpoP